MRKHWRDVRLVAQAVLITSAIWFVIFYLFGDKLPSAPSAPSAPAAPVLAGAGAGVPSARTPVAGRQLSELRLRVRGQRVAMADNAQRFDGPALVIPVAGIARDQLSDTYLDARGDGTRTHEALDIMADAGTAVYAAAPGTVEKLFWSDLGGNTVYVRSPDKRTIYYYAHLDAYRNGLGEGQAVRAGEPLGTVGSSGNADPAGPHLHFAVMTAQPDDSWSAGTPVNPYPLLAR